MKLVIFAGGVGTRLWPLSRENSPKQFDKAFEGKSTLELAFERLSSGFKKEDIYVQTIDKYVELAKEQLPDLPQENILAEPALRNLGPAICFTVTELRKRGFGDEAMAILWSDHLMKNRREFIQALKAGEALIQKEPNRLIFLGEKPRFTNNNLGWMKTEQRIGTEGEMDYYEFGGWKYKPGPQECREMFNSGDYYWNPGYFVTSIKFLEEKYKELAPNIYKAVTQGNYSEAESIHFDNAIIEKLDLSNAVIIKTNMGWSDPGTLYALKEALEESHNANVIKGKGNVRTLNTNDCLLYNKEKEKLVAAVGLHGLVVVNTEDVLVVAHKDEVVHITELLKSLKEEGLDKYL